ncbi:MAG: PDZ domain-containing protein [Planctomycetaceae bacterium]|nr:PDZ domain-containing protein [Planctomycetaceae bacterium]
MNRWSVTLLVGLTALIAGWTGHWIGEPVKHSFAQEAERGTAQAPDQAMSEDRGWIGLMVEEAPDGGIRVANVFPGGPSAFAGIRQGDVILKAGETKIQSEAGLAKQVEQWKPGTTATVVVQRGKRALSLKIDVGSLRTFHGHYVQEMLRRDPRDPNFSDAHGVSQADQNIELVRRLFEQNQRLETSLLELHKEVAALRQEIQQKKPKASR